MYIQKTNLKIKNLIKAYGKNQFTFFNGKIYNQSIVCLPHGIYHWNFQSKLKFLPIDFKQIFIDIKNIDIVIIGTGIKHYFLPDKTKVLFNKNNIVVESMKTSSAVRTFNVLLNEDRKVAAALIIV